MDQQTRKPRSTKELLATLEAAQIDLGKGSRRLATFFIENLETTAMLSSSEVSRRCGVNASSVVRLVQSLGFTGYREFQSVLQQHVSKSFREQGNPLASLATSTSPSRQVRLKLLADSGRSFIEAAGNAASQYSHQYPTVSIETEVYVSFAVDPIEFAAQIERAASAADGILLVAREHPAINDAVRSVTSRGTPVICLTTDLPTSGRTAYVGSDQYVSGATAGWLCGRMLPGAEPGRVLFVYSVPFRCHQDREQGFRNILRSEFPHLSIDEKVSSNESADVVHEAVMRYIEKNGPPAAIYNVSGANLGVGKALEDANISHSTVFIGHELNYNSRSLLERGIMDVTIGHDFEREISLAVDCVKMAQQGVQPVNRITQSQVFTRFNCAIF
jgi:LacI family transcriptional regulator